MSRRPDLELTKKEEETWRLVNFAVPANHRVKIKESEKVDKYLFPIRELKKLWNMKVNVIPTVIGVLGTVPKGLEKRLEE